MCTLQIQVFLNEATLAANKRVFERIVSLNDACSIPYENITRALRFLFGSSIIINFKLSFT